MGETEWYKGQGVMASGHRGGVCVCYVAFVCALGWGRVVQGARGDGKWAQGWSSCVHWGRGRVERMGQVVMASGDRNGVRVFVLCNVCVYTGVGEGYMEGARGGSKWCMYGVCMCVFVCTYTSVRETEGEGTQTKGDLQIESRLFTNTHHEMLV